MIGSGIGGLSGIADTALLLKERGPRKVSPFFIPGRLINLASGYVSIEHGLKGPNHAVVTACSTGAHAIGDASRQPGRIGQQALGGSPGQGQRGRDFLGHVLWPVPDQALAVLGGPPPGQCRNRRSLPGRGPGRDPPPRAQGTDQLRLAQRGMTALVQAGRRRGQQGQYWPCFHLVKQSPRRKPGPARLLVVAILVQQASGEILVIPGPAAQERTARQFAHLSHRLPLMVELLDNSIE
jgi:hypothetical protein